ncbi:hypothetical protein CXB51_032689 [Gossypium anomalum]|uniref:Uncharacterized protein n=1 Tax=Gossypium anomalum TaxID=47600 RepID=A0A8J6CM53_9ROSI|nr:hypothetical protein CXB51_032689 [Gossypium anomalum]
MDRWRTESPVYGRQWSGSSSSGSSSPAHPLSRLQPGVAGGLSNIKRTQNVAAKAAAQRLAQVMASQTPDDDEEDDDLGFRFGGPPIPPTFSNNGLNRSTSPAISLTRPNRSPSPALGRNFVEHASSVRSTSAGRPAMAMRSTTPNLIPPNRTSVRTPDGSGVATLGLPHSSGVPEAATSETLNNDISAVENNFKRVFWSNSQFNNNREEILGGGLPVDKITGELVQGILDAGKRTGHAICGGPVHNLDNAKKSVTAKFARFFYWGMLEEGVYFAPSEFVFF